MKVYLLEWNDTGEHGVIAAFSTREAAEETARLDYTCDVVEYEVMDKPMGKVCKWNVNMYGQAYCVDFWECDLSAAKYWHDSADEAVAAWQARR